MIPRWLNPDAWRAGPGPEAVVLFCALGVGVLVVPPLIWMVGSAALGPYAGGGLFALWGHFFTGLGTASLTYWGLALAPYALLWLVRFWLAVLRR